jgi:sugar transferase EpsL
MKRIVDIAGAFAGLVLLSPVMLFVALLIRIRLGRPVFFSQQRPGLNGKPFRLVKFRTMRDQFAADGTPLPDELRMTKLGTFLRKSSADELPELLNVLKGDMSLVGPRPLLMEYLPRYTPEQRRRHDVKPGLTGWAQVNGRNASSWEDRLARDVWYVDHQSFALDVRILFKTVIQVVSRQGVNAPNHVTMPPFEGEKS